MPFFKTILLTILFCGIVAAQNDDDELPDTTGLDLYELQNIDFEGNSNISSSILEGIIYSRETPWWFWKFLNSFTPFGAGPVYFDSSDIEQDLLALHDYYRTNGFFRASFSSKYEVDTAAREVDLIYTINEGEFSKFGRINFIGIDSVDPGITEDIFSDLTIDSTDRYIQTEVEANINNGVAILNNSGYPFAKFDSTVVIVDTLTNYTDLNVYITTGGYYLIDTVIVNVKGDGAASVDPKDIVHVTGIEKGEYYSREEIKLGEQRLFRAGLFNSLNIAHIDTGLSGNRIPIMLKGNIGNMNELSPEIIINNQQNALNIGTAANYTRKNFLGKIRLLNVRASLGVQDFFNSLGNIIKGFSFSDTTLLGFFDTRVTIEQPYLFNEPIHGILDNYYIIEKQRDFNINRYGAKITFDFELPHYTFVNMFSAFYNIEQQNEIFRAQNDSLSRRLLSIIGFNVGKTSTDNILFPTQGYSSTLEAEEANLLPLLVSKVIGTNYDEALFFKFLFNNAYYLSLNQRRTSIFASKLRLGYIRIYKGDYSGLPVTRTFYAGGSNSVRGWRANNLIPEGAPDIPGFQGQNKKGGIILIEGSEELRLRYGNLGTALFFDYGNVWLNKDDIRFDSFALAVGIGFRFYTQVAPFRLDFGFKLYDPANETFIWDRTGFFKHMEFHFGIGEAF